MNADTLRTLDAALAVRVEAAKRACKRLADLRAQIDIDLAEAEAELVAARRAQVAAQ